MYSFTEENYLKAIFSLSNDKGEVSVNDISKHLKIKMPTVTSMMKKLATKKLVDYQSYKPLKLTTEGKKVAMLVIRKHRLTEMYLVEKMGFGWEQVHQIAEQLEHIQSPELFIKIDELLGFPKFDPHGSPIPDKNGQMFCKAYKKLSDCSVGDDVKFSAVINTSVEFLQFLNTKELRLGDRVKIVSIEPFDQSMVVAYNQRNAETFSLKVCERLLIEDLE
jgi:DtxR family Mn-dependent transcriptional regulator